MQEEKFMQVLFRICLAVVVAALSAAQPAAAQNYPNRPIKLIVPFPAGGTNDIMARIFAQQVEQQIGQPVVVDNRGGANGVIGTQAVATAEPDGYTILHNSSSFTINRSIRKHLPYDIFKDFAPVANLAIGQGYLIVVNPQLPIHNTAELIEYAKKNRIHYGSAGTGNPLQLAAALFNVHAGVDIQSVPFRGTAPALNALLTNTIQVMFVPPASVLGSIEAGQIRAIGFTGDVRPKELPNVPLVKDALPKLQIRGAWHGWLAPAGTPKDVIATLSRELIKSLESPRVLELIRKSGYEPFPKGPDEFATLIKENADQMAEAVKAAKIEPQ
jgi:tripartite-type tricarboxylate transporter receptor subunit TctC